MHWTFDTNLDQFLSNRSLLAAERIFKFFTYKWKVFQKIKFYNTVELYA